jgi:hypothetical protein
MLKNSMGITGWKSKLHEIKMDNAKKTDRKTTDTSNNTGINKFIDSSKSNHTKIFM